MKQVSKWDTVDLAQIRQENRHGIFDCYNPDTRRELTDEDLEELEMTDADNDLEIPIYDVGGHQIQRRIARLLASTKPLAVLAELNGVRELFTTPNNIEDFDYAWPGPQQSTVNIYPQAGLRSAGHFQASGLMTGFYSEIEEINRDLRQDNPESPHYPIIGVACQGYNAVMHHTRGHGVQHHDAQQAIITNTIGAVFAPFLDGNLKRKANDLWKKCSQSLPHERFERKIENENICRNGRFENAYIIDLTALPDERRTGE